METKKSNHLAIVLAGVGAIVILLPLFGVMEDNQQALIFGGVISIVAAFLVKQLGEK